VQGPRLGQRRRVVATPFGAIASLALARDAGTRAAAERLHEAVTSPVQGGGSRRNRKVDDCGSLFQPRSVTGAHTFLWRKNDAFIHSTCSKVRFLLKQHPPLPRCAYVPRRRRTSSCFYPRVRTRRRRWCWWSWRLRRCPRGTGTV
jgi:hypothetical protein